MPPDPLDPDEEMPEFDTTGDDAPADAEPVKPAEPGPKDAEVNPG